jgi:regulator of protease activity HflC (stomatin/prohibitin superfamily)
MFGLKRIVIANHERGLYLKDRSIERILEPGLYWFYDLLGRISVQVYDLTTPEFDHARVDFLVKGNPKLVERYFHVIELGDHQVGLVYIDGRLEDVLAPSIRQLYWKDPFDVKVEILDITNEFALPEAVRKLLARPRAKQLLAARTQYVYLSEVADNFVGILVVNGELAEVLEPGLYAYWNFNRNVVVEHVDLRLQTMDVNGQEILTKDKVSLRANLSVTYMVTDPVKARETLVKLTEFLYRELQFGLRQAIGTRTLDALLGNKGELDRVIHEHVQGKVALHGIDVRGVGIKDLILPGDMKEILNQVVEAEKVAQANVIKRREETAATRSTLNTAKLMDDNPTLLRLKELEVLEKVTEKVDRLTVFGGLDGVLNDTVRIGVKAD